MGILNGGPKCYARKRCPGGLIVFFEWWNDEKNELGSGEPSMWIKRATHLALSGNRGAACITLAKAHEYADSKSGAPTPYLIEFAYKACIELGLEPSRMNTKAIADLVVDNLPTLVEMPPAPDADRFASRKLAPVGEVSLIADGKTVLEGEIPAGELD